MQLLLSDDLDPVIIRVDDEIQAHCGVLKADAAHFAVMLVSGVVIGGGKANVGFVLAEVIIGIGVVTKPCQLKAIGAGSVGKEGELEAAKADYLVETAEELGKLLFKMTENTSLQNE